MDPVNASRASGIFNNSQGASFHPDSNPAALKKQLSKEDIQTLGCLKSINDQMTGSSPSSKQALLPKIRSSSLYVQKEQKQALEPQVRSKSSYYLQRNVTRITVWDSHRELETLAVFYKYIDPLQKQVEIYIISKLKNRIIPLNPSEYRTYTATDEKGDVVKVSTILGVQGSARAEVFFELPEQFQNTLPKENIKHLVFAEDDTWNRRICFPDSKDKDYGLKFEDTYINEVVYSKEEIDRKMEMLEKEGAKRYDLNQQDTCFQPSQSNPLSDQGSHPSQCNQPTHEPAKGASKSVFATLSSELLQVLPDLEDSVKDAPGKPSQNESELLHITLSESSLNEVLDVEKSLGEPINEPPVKPEEDDAGALHQTGSAPIERRTYTYRTESGTDMSNSPSS